MQSPTDAMSIREKSVDVSVSSIRNQPNHTGAITLRHRGGGGGTSQFY